MVTRKGPRKQITKAETNAEDELAGRKDARKRITEVLLIDRLGLNGEWADPDNLPKSLPNKLSGNIAEKLPQSDKVEIEEELDRLVAVGCRRGVLYWCLQQLGPEQDRLRAGARWKSPFEEDKLQFTPLLVDHNIATQKDEMIPLINQIQATAKAISDCRRELLLSAQALGAECALPHGVFDEGPPDAVEAIATLQSSLLWVQRLAEFWEAPYEAAVVRTKGVLFLLAYVSIFGRGLSGRDHQKARPMGQGVVAPFKLASREAGILSRLVYLYHVLLSTKLGPTVPVNVGPTFG